MSTTRIKRQQVITLVQQGLGIREIAKRLKCSIYSVSRLKNGQQEEVTLQPRNKRDDTITKELTTDELKRKAVTLRAEGFTFDEISRCLGIAKGRAVNLVNARDLSGFKGACSKMNLPCSRCPDCGGLITTKVCLACFVRVEGKPVKRPYVEKVTTGYSSLSVG